MVLTGGMHILVYRRYKAAIPAWQVPCLVGLIIIHTNNYAYLGAQEEQKNL